MKEIRVHKKHQTDELARRFDPRALTVGSHAFGPMENTGSRQATQMSSSMSHAHPAPTDVHLQRARWQKEDTEAQMTEQMVMRTAQSDGEIAESSSSPQQVNAEAVADIVYRMMMHDLRVERERQR
ncbi:MAG: hypothetical protein SVM79_02720 [Chloroflexota bacterium]|nr:hypothetical protein [Chloroflexota bacterium]